MSRFARSGMLAYLALAVAFTGTSAHAGSPAPGRVAEHITLKNGFDLLCDHRAAEGGRVRLYLDAQGSNFLEVNAADIVADETVTLPAEAKPEDPAPAAAASSFAPKLAEHLTEEDLRPMLNQAGATYDIDADLLASVVRQESGGHARAVSRAGAQGLMQLMPGTAANLGVADAFVPGENIRGGTQYLNQLLLRYRNNVILALAAYNAGPAAVDRWHGVPPYSETRAYVARVIREYNRRYRLRHKPQAASAAQVAVLAH
jgi:soluble lytic murein transglycosylase-like protein